MIYFYQQEENRTTGRVIGGVATLLYFIVLVLLFLLVKFHQQEVTAAEGGLMINFGNVDEAAPGADMALNRLPPSPSHVIASRSSRPRKSKARRSR